MFKNTLLRTAALFIIIGFLLATAGRSSLARASAAAGPIDPAELAVWLEPLIGQQMAEAHIPGAVFLLVQDGQVAYARGYGLADLEQQTPVEVERSLWRVMSLSKSVTAAAVMQLAEKGQIDLHADANAYLRSYQLPEAFGQPITADQLLTHSAGLDWDLDDIGAEAATPADLIGNAPFLNQHPPRRAFPPGQHYLYSNAAFDLAGQMVEDVSGIPFAEYTDRYIFQPLGMAHSSFLQPPPQADGLVAGYEFDGQSHQPVELPFWQDPPSRSLTSTAADMARFIQAMLGDGAPILQAESLRALLETHFTYRDGQPGLAYGWHDISWPNIDAVAKDGGAPGALSRIFLAPDHDLGFFLAYNLDDDFGMADAIQREMLERTFPYQADLPPTAAGAAERGQALAGVYRQTTYSRLTIAKLLRLPWPDYPRVSALEDGRLMVQFAPDTETTHELLEMAPRHYRKSDGEFDYVFLQDAQGQPAGLAVGDWATEKVAWYDTGRAHMLMLVAFVAFFLGSAVAGLIIGLRRPPAHRLARRGLWLLTAIAALNFVFLVTFFLLLQSVVLGISNIDFAIGMPVWLAALFVLPLLTIALTVVLLALGLAGWRRRAFSGRGLALLGSFTLAALLFIPWLNYWNLLGFNW